MKSIADAKLFELISILDAREWKALGRMNRVKEAHRLSRFYQYLDAYYPDFKQIASSRQEIYQVVFGNEPFNDKKLRYLFTDLQSAAEELLTTMALQSEPEAGRRLLMSELARRGAAKNYLSHYHKDEETIHRDASGTPEKYFADFRREETHLMYYLPQRPRGVTNIDQAARNLDLFYLVKKLQLLCEMINVRNVMAVDTKPALAEEIAGALMKGTYSDVPAVAAWHRVWLTLTQPELEEHFLILKETLDVSGKTFPQKELRDLYQYLMNYCIRRINTGNTSYIHTLLDIYKILLAGGILLTDEQISQWDYKNITAIGVRAGESAWTSGFIESYKSKLPKAERENAYRYNMAYYHFNTGKHSTALSLLQQVEFSDLYYQLDSRVILLKCYFENGDEDAFFYHASAFRLFLARNKQVSAYQRTVYRNLLKYTTQILRAFGNKQKLTAIKEEVERVRNVADIGWVLKKL